ncbi:C45 family autoproteolytic acyltransferase/hydrolase [Actinoplanes sp. CA-015351]|uniref:C45 family autoproteolytic acyltransferase/hydolase n=1 Tax=Actinoplanes sp. CA-015351 TaxID=3239897 RepID=UPI003D95A6F0
MTTRTFRSSVLGPRERGEEFGRTFSDEISACVFAYTRLFEMAASGPVDLDHLGGLAREAIWAISGEIAEEINGLAAGSGRSVAEICAINARTEILALLKSPATVRGECSTVVRLNKNGQPLAVQAWDWYESLAGSWLVWEIPHPDGSVTTTLTEYGIVGKIGVNSRGLGVLFNILHHAADGSGIGAPVHVLSRAVLDGARDLNQALVRLAGAPVSASSALTLVAARDGECAAVSVEVNPVRVGYVLPDADGLLLHTNHFLSSPASSGDTELITGPDSVVRLDLLRRRLASSPDVIAAMNSHLLGGGGLCCHADPALPAASRFATLAVVELDVASGTLTAHPGGPCSLL